MRGGGGGERRIQAGSETDSERKGWLERGEREEEYNLVQTDNSVRERGTE